MKMEALRWSESPRRFGVGAFSLVELLVVIAIISVLAVLAVTAFSDIQRSSGVTGGGNLLADSIALARETAASRNRLVDVRLVASPDPTRPDGTGLNSFQLWIADRDGSTFEPQSKLSHFQSGVEVVDSTSLSPLLDRQSGTANFGTAESLAWKGFRIRPDGSLAGAAVGADFLTIRHERDDATPPQNFFAIRVDPVTGRVTTYRP